MRRDPPGAAGTKIIQRASTPQDDRSAPLQLTARKRLTNRFGERAFALIVTIGLEVLLLLALLSLGMLGEEESPPQPISITTFNAVEAGAEAESEAEAEQQQDTPPTPNVEQPAQPPAPLEMVPIPRPLVTPAPIIPPLPEPPEPAEQPVPDDRPRAVIRSDRSYGPENTGGRANGNADTPIVGTAPDGSPLYAARWFREPTRQEMSGYLSTVEPPAWALIACRTAPRWEVVDCVPLEQSSPDSNIMNAVLASTWQYQVRPPRRGNQSLVGSWVRIRISYTRGGTRASY